MGASSKSIKNVYNLSYESELIDEYNNHYDALLDECDCNILRKEIERRAQLMLYTVEKAALEKFINETKRSIQNRKKILTNLKLGIYLCDALKK